MTQLLDDLRAARELVAAGWCQRAFHKRDPEPRWCPTGAIGKVVDPREFGMKRYNAAMAVLRTTIDCHSVVMWNDAPERTQADVVAAFTAAIQRAEQAERGMGT